MNLAAFLKYSLPSVSAGIVTRLLAERPRYSTLTRYCVLIPCKAKKISLSKPSWLGCGTHPASHLKVTEDYSKGWDVKLTV